MKMGLIVFQSTDLEKVISELEMLKKKAIRGFKKEEIIENDFEFEIVKNDIKIIFKMDKLYDDEFAIFQIIK